MNGVQSHLSHQYLEGHKIDACVDVDQISQLAGELGTRALQLRPFILFQKLVSHISRFDG